MQTTLICCLLILVAASSASASVSRFSNIDAGRSPSDRIDPHGLVFDVGGADLPGFVPVAPLLNDVTITNADSGRSFDFTSGPIFDTATEVLTNGTNDWILMGYNEGGLQSNEVIMFGTAPDFMGSEITRISFILGDVEITPRSHYIEYAVEVESGDAPAVAVPEPSSLVTFALLMGGLCVVCYRAKHSPKSQGC